MRLRIGDTVPDFSGDTTIGRIALHDWIEDRWAILVTHLKNFTPVSTTELASLAELAPNFLRRKVRVLCVSAENREAHEMWITDVEESHGVQVTCPIVADPEGWISDLFDAANPGASGTIPVRTVFVIGPDAKIRLIAAYPQVTGCNFHEILRVVDSLQLAESHRVSTPANWEEGGDVLIEAPLTGEELRAQFPGGVHEVRPYLRLTPNPKS